MGRADAKGRRQMWPTRRVVAAAEHLQNGQHGSSWRNALGRRERSPRRSRSALLPDSLGVAVSDDVTGLRAINLRWSFSKGRVEVGAVADAVVIRNMFL